MDRARQGGRVGLQYAQRHVLLCVGLVGLLGVGFGVGCAERRAEPTTVFGIPDTREALPLNPEGRKAHREVMLQHLETLQVIVAALAEEDYERAKGLTEAHLGFFMHREAMARQHPEQFPPAYHDLAMAHHQAAEDLAAVMPTKDLKRILPKFNLVLRACVACHIEYKLSS